VSYSRLVSLSFLAGALFAAAVGMLYQDWYGLEGYIQRCRDHWWPAAVTVPIACAVLAAAWMLHAAVHAIARKCDALAGARCVKRMKEDAE
jgi:hypothetical protein